MFWIIVSAVVVAFVALVGWTCRPKGSAKGRPASDLDSNVRQAKKRTLGEISYYE